MNDEIKEILDNTKKCCEIMQDENFVVYQKKDIIKLLDYITNLKQELQKKDNIIKFIKQYINDNCWGYAGIDEDGINILLDKIKELEKM